MKNFAYYRPATVSDAVARLASGAHVLAGGTTMVDLMKLDVVNPDVLVDITGLPELSDVVVGRDRIRFGALAKMQAVADNADIKRAAPVISETLWKAASPQLRWAATLGGNVLQRTRCAYFRDTAYPKCNKRDPGSGCSALDGGETNMHAIHGGSNKCVAMYPGDFAQAMVAFDAEVVVAGPSGTRRIAFADLHVLPGDDPSRETILKPNEIIVALEVPLTPALTASHYLKARDRESYAFASASAAVGLAMNGDTVADARIALGGVAAKPWRARAAEDALKGKAFSEDAAREAGRIAFQDARALEGSAYKIPLGASVVAGALMTARQRAGQEAR